MSSRRSLHATVFGFIYTLMLTPACATNNQALLDYVNNNEVVDPAVVEELRKSGNQSTSSEAQPTAKAGANQSYKTGQPRTNVSSAETSKTASSGKKTIGVANSTSDEQRVAANKLQPPRVAVSRSSVQTRSSFMRRQLASSSPWESGRVSSIAEPSASTVRPGPRPHQPVAIQNDSLSSQSKRAKQSATTSANASSQKSPILFPTIRKTPADGSKSGGTRRAPIVFSPQQAQAPQSKNDAGNSSRRRVTYRARGHGWSVVSGYENGKIFYEKQKNVGGKVVKFSLKYLPEERAKYDRIIKQLDRTL